MAGKKIIKKWIAGILAVMIMIVPGLPVAHAEGNFRPRTTAPNVSQYPDSEYYKDGNPFYGVAGLNNCTNYAYGRAYELLGYKPNLSHGAPADWWSYNDGYERSTDPKSPRLGAIMCWDGHVAVVEEINGDEINFSEASYSPSYAFQYKENIKVNSLSNIYRGTFRGYIYLPGIGAGEPQGSPISDGYRSISDGDYHIVSAVEGNRFNPGRWCLTIGGLPSVKNTPGANAELWPVFGQEEHVFTVTWLGNGYYKIKLKGSTQALDVADASLSRGTNVQQYNDHGGDPQQWVIKQTDDGSGYTIQAKCNGWYLDVEDGKTEDGTNIRLWEGNGSNAQKWLFVPWGGSLNQELLDGEYQIVSKLDNNKALNAEGNGISNGTNIILWPCVGDERHTFNVRWLGGGCYEIINKNSNLALDVDGGWCKGGANVQLYERLNENNKKWIIRSCGNGYFNIISKCNGLYLDLTDAKTDNGTNVQMCVGWGYTGADCQQWKFIPWNTKPVIQTLPSASEITYGQTLADSILSGGKANTGGTFTWKDSSLRPTCSDSEKTRYTVVFTPSNTASWEAVETDITIKVNPAQKPPNMPDSVINASQDKQTVSDVGLPSGWAWLESDKGLTLKSNISVTANAIYIGGDKGNYVNEQVVVSIRKPNCLHPKDKQEKRNVLAASCEKEGYTGDIYCTECGNVIENGQAVAALGHEYRMELIKEPTKDEEGERVYICIRCKDTYKEAVLPGRVCQVTVVCTEGGNVTGSGSYSEGETATVTAIPATGYRFVKWVEYETESAAFAATEHFNIPGGTDTARPPALEWEDQEAVSKATPNNAQRPPKTAEEEEDNIPWIKATPNNADKTSAKENIVVAITRKSIRSFMSLNAEETVVSTDPQYTFTVTGDRSLKAVFEKEEVPPVEEYTIRFQANGGTVAVGFGITEKGRLPGLPTPTRSGYSFTGWFTEAEGGYPVTSDTVFITDQVIYAQWNKIDDSADIGGSTSSGGDSGNQGDSGNGGDSGSQGDSGSGGNSGSQGDSGNGGNSGSQGDSDSGGDSGNGGNFDSGSSSGSGDSSGSSSSGGGRSKSSADKNGITGSTLPSYVVVGTWIASNGQWQFIDGTGQQYKGKWAAVDNPYANMAAGQSAFDWFYFDEAGNMVTGWFRDVDGNLYYLNPVCDGTQGRMMTGWTWISDETGVSRCYYLNPESDGFRGRMVTNTIVDGYTVNADGYWVVNGVIQIK